MDLVFIKDWEDYFNKELKWTSHLRDRLYEKSNITQKKNLLEIGCGTGELLKEIGVKFNLKLFGIDTSKEKIHYAKQNLMKNMIDAKLSTMNLLNNSFDNNKFDVIITHFLFLWIKDLNRSFDQIYRILKKDGILLIFGEPDYGGLIEHPDTNLQKELMTSLTKLGADPEIGRKLYKYFFKQFKVEEHFCTSFPWIPTLNKNELLEEVDFFKEKLNNKKFNSGLMRNSIKEEKYFLFVPVFSYYLKKI